MFKDNNSISVMDFVQLINNTPSRPYRKMLGISRVSRVIKV